MYEAVEMLAYAFGALLFLHFIRMDMRLRELEAGRIRAQPQRRVDWIIDYLIPRLWVYAFCGVAFLKWIREGF